MTLKVQAATSTTPGSESFEVNLPLNIGNLDLTNDPAFASLRARGSTLAVVVSWFDLGGAGGIGGYALGYKGSSSNARIDYVIRWKPPIKRQFAPAGLTPLNAPVVAFPNPGGAVGGGGELDAVEMFNIPGFDPVAPEGATVLGLAFNRSNSTLLVLMDNPTPGGNDTILVLLPSPGFGFLLDAIDTGTPDAQDVAWLANTVDVPKSPANPGSVWIAIQSGGTKQIKRIVPAAETDTPITVVDGLPLRGLGAISYAPLGSQHMLPSFFQANPDLGIPVHLVRPDTGADVATMIVPAGPTGGGYNDIVVNDAMGVPPSGLGAFDDKLGEFNIPSGFFLGSKDVVSGGAPLANIVGLAMDAAGTLYLANQASPGMVYTADLSGGGGGGGGEFARAITNDPTHIFMVMDDTAPTGKDEIVRTDGAGNEVNRYTAPGTGHEGLAFLGGFLYTVDNDPFPLKLYKLDPATGAVQADYPKDLSPLVEHLGDLTVNAAGNKLIGVARFSDKLYEIDPDTGGVTSTKTMVAVPPAFNPFGMEGLTLVTGAPGGDFLLGTAGTGFFFINISTGSIYDFKPVSVFPPFNLTGLTQRGSDIYMTDDSQQVFRASIPGAPAPDDTSAGAYAATLTVTLNPDGAPPPVTTLFSIVKVALEATITEPKDGATFTSTPITAEGLVVAIAATGQTPGQQIVGELNTTLGNLVLATTNGKGTATVDLGGGLTVESDATLKVTAQGIDGAMEKPKLVFKPVAPSAAALAGGSADVTNIGVDFKTDLKNLPDGASVSVQFAKDASAFIATPGVKFQLAAQEAGGTIADLVEDIAFTMKVTKSVITNLDLGDNTMDMTVSKAWYDKKKAQGKGIFITKMDDNGNVVATIPAVCVVTGDSAKCTATFTGAAGGFSIFTLVAVQVVVTPTPTPTATPVLATPTPTPTRPVPVTPTATPVPGTPTPTPTLVSITSTPTPTATATPVVVPTPTATPVPVSAPGGAPLGLIIGIVVAVLIVGGGAVYFLVLRKR